MVLCICSIQIFYSQEDDGVVSLSLPVRNSLTFNRYTINPTFSFVREQTKFISVFNKREWTGFEDAPLTYLASYSGRFGENIGAGLGVFQQNYGVLTTFGGVLNFAYNVRLARESNLTFGLNVGAYKSGINTGNVVTNFSDPSLQNVPENFLLNINPGINYGTGFLDFGVSIKNLALYNFKSSKLVEDNPEQSIQAHIMHTGYLESRGFFYESKFSGLLKSEFRKDKTIISALAMLTVPKGIWAQAGYNTHYGISGGIGINITSQIAIEYNFEKTLGGLTDFGSSHEITLAYRFKNNENYDYSRADDVSGLISTKPKRKVLASKVPKTKTEAKAQLVAEQKAKEEAEAQAQLVAEQKAKEEAEAQAQLVAEQKAKEEAEAQAQLVAEQKAKEEAEAQAQLVAEQKAKEETAAQAQLVAEQKAKEEAEAQAQLVAEQKAKEEAEAQAQLIAEQKAKEEAEAQLLTEQKAKEELISNPKDAIEKEMYALTKETEASKKIQTDLIKKYNDIIEVKDKDLKDLKEENDLSEQGIAVKPKAFKSITEENNKLNNIKDELDKVIEERTKKIEELEELYDDKYEADTLYNDEVYLYYKKALDRLKLEQFKAIETRSALESRLETIKVATDFERRRRIKRAVFDNEQERYLQDRATLKNIKQITEYSNVQLQAEDFDFGEEQSANIQILKNVQNVDNGYYIILAVHSDIEKRNDFVTKIVASGRKNIDFFYDVNTSKYYIYYDKYYSINEANEGLKQRGNTPYNVKMSLVKIEN